MNEQLSDFVQFLTTGHLGLLTDHLTLSDAFAKLGVPHGQDMQDEMPSSFTGALVTHRNLYYDDLSLSFSGEQLCQYNFEVRYQTKAGLPVPLNAQWYKQIRQWNPEQLRTFLQQAALVSRCYRLIYQFSPMDEEFVVVVDSSQLWWFFDNRQLYKISWKALEDNEEHFFRALGGEIVWQT